MKIYGLIDIIRPKAIIDKQYDIIYMNKNNWNDIEVCMLI